MNSPIASPSLRAMTHQLHPRAPASYFPQVPPALVSSAHVYNYSPKIISAKPLNPSSPLVGCMRTTDRATSISTTSPRPSRPQLENRRSTIRQSAIPLFPQAAKPRRSIHTPTEEAESGRRRPSFKIELPPRPAPLEIAASVHTSRCTPHPEHAPAPAVPVQSTPMTFRNPFVQGEYIILAPSRTPEPGFSDAFPSPSAGPGVIGLGYSLNRMRAPTPWIRGAGRDEEWVSAQDLEDMEVVEGGMRGLGFA